MPLLLINQPHQPKARILLAHGAGASADSAVMQQLALALAAEQIEVIRFNFPYMQRQLTLGRKSFPDKMPLLLAAMQQQIQQCASDLPLFIGGKSLGGRVASVITAQAIAPSQQSTQPKVLASFAFGYPFHAPKKTAWRTEHFADLATPLHILQGERDAFGNKLELADKTWPKVSLDWLPDGDHDFKPRKTSGYTQAELIALSARLCKEKIDEILLAN
jgi:uncharacterized protein